MKMYLKLYLINLNKSLSVWWTRCSVLSDCNSNENGSHESYASKCYCEINVASLATSRTINFTTNWKALKSSQIKKSSLKVSTNLPPRHGRSHEHERDSFVARFLDVLRQRQLPQQLAELLHHQQLAMMSVMCCEIIELNFIKITSTMALSYM